SVEGARGQEAQIRGYDVVIRYAIAVDVHQHVVFHRHRVRGTAEGVHRKHQLRIGAIREGLHTDRPQPGRAQADVAAAQAPGVEVGRAGDPARAVAEGDRA